MVRAVQCDSRVECLDEKDENGCDSDPSIVAGEVTIRYNKTKKLVIYCITVTCLILQLYCVRRGVV